MEELAHPAAVQPLSKSACRAKVAAVLKSRDRWPSALRMALCLVLSLTPTLAHADAICFLEVLKLKNSGHQEAQNYVINTEAEWRDLWEKIFSNTAEPPLPEIDFARRTIIAVFQGTQASGGYEISIEEIVESDASLDVIVKAFAPGKRCVVTGAVTRPFDIVEIEKTDKEVIFHVKRRVRNCG